MPQNLVIAVCEICGKETRIKPYRKDSCRFCSIACRAVSTGQNAYSRIEKNCVVCGKIIMVKKSHQKIEGTYCSRECMANGYKERVVRQENPNWKGGSVLKQCKQCGSEYEATRSQINSIGREFCTVSCSATWRMIHEEISGRAKGGRREDLDDRYFRSSWEANYARYLNWLVSLGEIRDWKYESETFIFPGIKRGNMTYLPDFKIVNNDNSTEYHEVKGYMDSDSATKLRRMAKYYPQIKVVLIDKEVYQAISKQARHFVPNWEIQRRK